MSSPIAFSKNISVLLAWASISPNRLGELIGMSGSSVYRLLGRTTTGVPTMPRVSTTRKIAAVFGISTHDLCYVDISDWSSSRISEIAEHVRSVESLHDNQTAGILNGNLAETDNGNLVGNPSFNGLGTSTPIASPVAPSSYFSYGVTQACNSASSNAISQPSFMPLEVRSVPILRLADPVAIPPNGVVQCLDAFYQGLPANNLGCSVESQTTLPLRHGLVSPFAVRMFSDVLSPDINRGDVVVFTPASEPQIEEGNILLLVIEINGSPTFAIRRAHFDEQKNLRADGNKFTQASVELISRTLGIAVAVMHLL